MPARTFALVTLIGALPIVVLYVLAGEQFATIDAARRRLERARPDRFVRASGRAASPSRRSAAGARRAPELKPWPRPRKFDYNLIVIGAGSAGLVTAYVAAAARARVALIERGEMGGDCLNTGCVPSKALIRSAKLAAEGARAARIRAGRRPEAGLSRRDGALAQRRRRRSLRTIPQNVIAASAPT